MKSKVFLARSLINRKLGWAKESCWITLLVMCEVCLTFLLHPLGTSGKQEGKPMRFSLLSQHTAGTCERKVDPRARWTCLELALRTYWLSVNGTGRIGSLFGINSYADASVRKLSWLENQTCEGGSELPVFPTYSTCFLWGEFIQIFVTCPYAPFLESQYPLLLCLITERWVFCGNSEMEAVKICKSKNGFARESFFMQLVLTSFQDLEVKGF